MTRITDERLAELEKGWLQQAGSIHDCSLAGSMYQSSCNETAIALRELQYRRTENERLRKEREDLSRRVHELEKHATEVARAFHERGERE